MSDSEIDVSCIKIELLSYVERDLMIQELVSIIFLLYDEVPVALERLCLVLNLYRNNKFNAGVSLLHDWAINVKSDLRWKHKLLEALSLIRCWSIIRKLGFNLDAVKRHYRPCQLETSFHIHPAKKVMYMMCENLDSFKTNMIVEYIKNRLGKDFCEKLEDSVNKHFVDYLELFFMQLVKEKHVELGYYLNINEETQQSHNSKCNIELVSDVCKLFDIKYSQILLKIQAKINHSFDILDTVAVTYDVKGPLEFNTQIMLKSESCNNMTRLTHSGDTYCVNEGLQNNDLNHHSDLNLDERYPIYDPSDLGTCIIINQCRFYRSATALDLYPHHRMLSHRNGTNVDRDRLIETWKKFNVETVVYEDVKHYDIIPNIESAIENKVKAHHSLFILCILSHGIKGEIYGVDSVPLEVSKIRECLWGSRAPILNNKPKLFIIQACQGSEMLKRLELDGPNTTPPRRMKVSDVSDICEYWSCLPNFVSLRDIEKGSWFIQTLCDVLDKSNGKRHICELLTQTTREVTEKTDKNTDISMHPMSSSSFRRMLYLPKPCL